MQATSPKVNACKADIMILTNEKLQSIEGSGGRFNEIGWVQNMLISINKRTKEVVYNPKFNLLKHLSHFVLPGVYCLHTSGGKDTWLS